MRSFLGLPAGSPWLGLLVVIGFVGVFALDVLRPEYQDCALYLVPVFVALAWRGRVVMLVAGGIAILFTFLAISLSSPPIELLSMTLYNRVAMSVVLGTAVLFAWWKEGQQAQADIVKDRLAAIAQATNDAIWDYDLVKDELWWTQGHQMLFGVLPSPSIEGWYERIHSDDRERVVKGFRRAIEEVAQHWRAEYRYLRSDGSYVDVLDRAEIRRNANGKAIRMVGGMTDITAQKQAFRALQDAHVTLEALSQKYQVLIDQAMTGIYLIQHGRLVFVNPRICSILQRSAEALLALPSVLEIIAPEDRALVEQRMKERITGVEVSAHYEVRVVRSDGSFRWLEVYGTRIDFEGAPAILGMANDVTERKQAFFDQQKAHQALEALSQKYRALIDQAITGVYLIQRGRFVFVNPRICSILQRSAEALLALPSVSEIVAPEDRTLFAKRMKDRLAGVEVSAHYEARVVRHDGSVRWVEVHGTRIDYEGAPAVLGMAIDVTERKQAFFDQQKSHQALEALSQKYQALIDQAVTGVSLIQHGRYVFVNPKTCTILQRSAEELLALPSAVETVAPEDRALVEQRMKDRLAGVEVSAHYVLRAVRPDGSLRWVEVYGTRIDYEGAPAILGMANDVTERKQAEEAQQRLLAELVTARERLQGLSQRLMYLQEEERREIARDLHDEIGQALTLLRADLSDAKRTITGKLTMDPCARLDSGLATADGLIQRVRAMSLNLRPVMLDDLGLPDTIRWYIDQIAPRAGWNADVVADEELEDLPKPIALAAFRIMQESLTNVMRHASATQVWVEAVKKDGSLQLCIRDNGKGFDVERVLERAGHGGSVGLLSMQERLRVFGGELALHSTPGTGTMVQMQIPLEVAV